jgi:prepilin-type N-terminal cleavage/methylation domain-containing protein
VKKARAGFTLLELLVVLGILGILMSIGIPMLRPPSSYLFVNDLKAVIQQARYEAIKRNVPVAVVWNSTDQSFTTQFHPSDPALNQACNTTGTTILNTKRLSEYQRVSVKSAFVQNGLVWLPNGLGRQCTGAGMQNVTEITDGRVAYKVNVSAAGRITLEKQKTP